MGNKTVLPSTNLRSYAQIIYMTRSETHCYRVANKDFSAIYSWLPLLRCDSVAHAPKTCTNSCKESSGRSVGIAASYYHHLWNQQMYMYEICFITWL